MVSDGRGVGLGQMEQVTGFVAVSIAAIAVFAVAHRAVFCVMGRSGRRGRQLERGGVGRVILVGEEADVVAVFFLQEAQGQVPEDIVHDRLRHGDLFVTGEARRLEAGVDELVHQRRERDAVLQGQRDGGGEAVHQA